MHRKQGHDGTALCTHGSTLYYGKNTPFGNHAGGRTLPFRERKKAKFHEMESTIEALSQQLAALQVLGWWARQLAA